MRIRRTLRRLAFCAQCASIGQARVGPPLRVQFPLVRLRTRSGGSENQPRVRRAPWAVEPPGTERVQREPRRHSARRTSSRGRRLSSCAQKRAFWHPFVALVGPTLRVQFPLVRLRTRSGGSENQPRVRRAPWAVEPPGTERVQREPRRHSARRTSSRGRRLSSCAQKRAFWHPFVALVGPTLRVQFPPQEPNECNERWWRRWELNPRPQRLRIMRYVRLPGTPRRVSLCLSSAVIQVMNTTMRSPDLPLIAAEP